MKTFPDGLLIMKAALYLMGIRLFLKAVNHPYENIYPHSLHSQAWNPLFSLIN